MQEYWINVFEYKTIKDRQFYSHKMGDVQSLFHRIKREEDRPDCKCVYRIHVKMKDQPKYLTKPVYRKPTGDWMA